jgi:predicted type IV restriction endonuclease
MGALGILLRWSPIMLYCLLRQTMNNEAFSRVLIDKALEFSGWNLLDPKEVRFELSGSNGRADYVLSGQRGPLGVLEAKREDVDPHNLAGNTPARFAQQ